MFDFINGIVEASYAWYEQQPAIVQLIVGVILIKNILLRWISDEIRKFIFEPIGMYVRKNIIEGRKDRAIIIREHIYAGHTAKLKDCQEDSCQILSLVE